MSGQQVLHYVQTFSAIKICWLAGKNIKLVSSNGLLEAFATFTGCGCTSNALQLDNFGTFARFLRDVITGDFAAQYVIRSNMAHHFTFRCLAVKSDNRDVRLISHLHSITHCVGVGRVNQQNFGAANG